MARSSTKKSTKKSSSKAATKAKPTATTKKPSSAKKQQKQQQQARGKNLGSPQEVCGAVFDFMCGEHSFGMEQWSKTDLACALGYSNPRSDKFAKALSLLTKTQGLAEKGSAKDTLKLTAKGLAAKPGETTPATLEEVHERFLARLNGKAKCTAANIRTVWDVLADRKVHGVASLSSKCGYSNPRSFGNTKLIPLMKTMGLVEDAGKGKIKMTDKAFPKGL